jgi:hypothetical protein
MSIMSECQINNIKNIIERMNLENDKIYENTTFFQLFTSFKNNTNSSIDVNSFYFQLEDNNIIKVKNSNIYSFSINPF